MSASRSVAALAAFTEVAGCPTARAAFTQGVDLDRLLAGTGYDVAFGQSELAFARGTRFVAIVKGDRGNGVCSYGPMLELLRDELGFDISQARTANLRALHPPPPPHLLATHKRHLAARAADTRRLIDEIARGVPSCVNFIDGAVLSATVGGQTAFYETDGLAFRLGGQLRIVEIKSFPKVDGQVDPAALASALDQGALYTLLVERLLTDLGLGASLVSRRLVLICPRNVALRPCLSERDVSARIRRIERLLHSIPNAGSQPVAPFADAGRAAKRSVADRVAALEDICDQVGTCYSDACQACGLLRLCRERAHASGDVRSLGERLADPARILADELSHETLDEMLRDHQHPDARMLAANLKRRPQPVISQIRRQRTSTIATSGLWPLTLRSRSGRITGTRDNLDLGLLEQPCDALPKQELIIGDDCTQRRQRPRAWRKLRSSQRVLHALRSMPLALLLVVVVHDESPGSNNVAPEPAAGAVRGGRSVSRWRCSGRRSNPRGLMALIGGRSPLASAP